MALRKLKSYLLTFVREVSSLKFSLFTVYLFIYARIYHCTSDDVTYSFDQIFTNILFSSVSFLTKIQQPQHHQNILQFITNMQICLDLFAPLSIVKSILCYFSSCRDIQRRQRFQTFLKRTTLRARQRHCAIIKDSESSVCERNRLVTASTLQIRA